MSAPEVDLHPAIVAWGKRATELAAELPSHTEPRLRRIAARRVSDRIAAEFTTEAPAGVTIDETAVRGPGGDLPLRVVTPAGWRSPGPVQIWLHGGGFVSGSAAELVNDRLLAGRAAATGIRFVSVDYRLAPEHPYPAAVDDALAALDVAATDRAFGADTGRIGIGGNSAGGGIAASAALRVRDAGGPTLVHQALEVPAVALLPIGESAERYAVGFGLDDAPLLPPLYLRNGAPDEYASPLQAGDLAGVAPALVHVAEFDPLRDAGLAYAARLAAAGVPTTVLRGEGQLHGSPALTAVTDGARLWQHAHAAALRTAYATD